MYKTEELAFKWLLNQGYKEKDIVYQSRRSPDFILSDGKKFEVKKLYGRVIWFTAEQFDIIKEENTTVLVFDLETPEPLAIFTMDQLEPNAVVDGIKITVKPPFKRTTVSVSSKTKQRLFKLMGSLISVDGRDRSLDDVINELIDVFEKKR